MNDSISLARDLRVLALKMVASSSSSHIGSALSIADVVAVLFSDVLVFQEEDPGFSGRDRFILSKGHACSIVYAALHKVGWLSEADLRTYGVDFSNLMTHISHKIPGVEFSSGSLGHGLPFACGKALYAKMHDCSWKTFVIVSDGELNEGSNWEAFMFGAHHNLDNLTVLIDYNKLQSLGAVSSTLGIEPLVRKLESFGWAVTEVDGHNHSDLRVALASAPFQTGKPSVMVMHTTKGKGVSFMENQVSWHYRSPSREELKMALLELSVA